MKRIRFIFLLIGVIALAGCEDSLHEDNIYDNAFFGPYDGNDIRFLDISFDDQMNSEGCYTCHYYVMNYLPDWPAGEFQARYSTDHYFEPDSLFVFNVSELHSMLQKRWFSFRGYPFLPGNTVYFRICYQTYDGRLYYSDEVAFQGR